jgi:hypothetical protein
MKSMVVFFLVKGSCQGINGCGCGCGVVVVVVMSVLSLLSSLDAGDGHSCEPKGVKPDICQRFNWDT